MNISDSVKSYISELDYCDEYEIELDEKGHVIHLKDSNGYEYWLKYDEKENVIYCINSDGAKSWDEYDEMGNKLHYKNSDGYEYWNEYDKGRLIHHKTLNGKEYWNEYDDQGRLIQCIFATGIVQLYDYNEEAKTIHCKKVYDPSYLEKMERTPV